jgi:hypothetical protein
MAYRVSGISRKLTVPIAATVYNAAPRHVGALYNITIIPPLAFDPGSQVDFTPLPLYFPGRIDTHWRGSRCVPGLFWTIRTELICLTWNRSSIPFLGRPDFAMSCPPCNCRSMPMVYAVSVPSCSAQRVPHTLPVWYQCDCTTHWKFWHGYVLREVGTHCIAHIVLCKL